MSGKSLAHRSEPRALVQRIESGDRRAEADFIRSYYPGVKALVRRQCRPADPSVDDLTQAVMQSVLERLRKGALNDPSSLPLYLRNAVIFAVRSEYRRRNRQDGVGETPATDSMNAVEDPERRTQRQQMAGLVRTLLDEMKIPRDREVLRLHYLAQEDHEVICDALQIDDDHFHRVLHRARERFRQLLILSGLRES